MCGYIWVCVCVVLHSLVCGFGLGPAIQIVYIVVFNRGTVGQELLTVHAQSFVDQTEMFGLQR